MMADLKLEKEAFWKGPVFQGMAVLALALLLGGALFAGMAAFGALFLGFAAAGVVGLGLIGLVGRAIYRVMQGLPDDMAGRTPVSSKRSSKKTKARGFNTEKIAKMLPALPSQGAPADSHTSTSIIPKKGLGLTLTKPFFNLYHTLNQSAGLREKLIQSTKTPGTTLTPQSVNEKFVKEMASAVKSAIEAGLRQPPATSKSIPASVGKQLYKMQNALDIHTQYGDICAPVIEAVLDTAENQDWYAVSCAFYVEVMSDAVENAEQHHEELMLIIQTSILNEMQEPDFNAQEQIDFFTVVRSRFEGDESKQSIIDDAIKMCTTDDPDQQTQLDEFKAAYLDVIEAPPLFRPF